MSGDDEERREMAIQCGEGVSCWLIRVKKRTKRPKPPRSGDEGDVPWEKLGIAAHAIKKEAEEN